MNGTLFQPYPSVDDEQLTFISTKHPIPNGGFLTNQGESGYDETEKSFTKLLKSTGQRAQSWDGKSTRFKEPTAHEPSTSNRDKNPSPKFRSLVNYFSDGPDNEMTIPPKPLVKRDDKAQPKLRQIFNAVDQPSTTNHQETTRENHIAPRQMRSSIKLNPTIELKDEHSAQFTQPVTPVSPILHRQVIHLTLGGKSKEVKENDTKGAETEGNNKEEPRAETEGNNMEEPKAATIKGKSRAKNKGARLGTVLGGSEPTNSSELAIEQIPLNKFESHLLNNKIEIESCPDALARTPTPKLRTRTMKKRSHSQSLSEPVSQGIDHSPKPEAVYPSVIIEHPQPQKTVREIPDFPIVLRTSRDTPRTVLGIHTTPSVNELRTSGQLRVRESPKTIKPSNIEIPGSERMVRLENYQNASVNSVIRFSYGKDRHNRGYTSDSTEYRKKFDCSSPSGVRIAMGADEVRITPSPHLFHKPSRQRIATIREEDNDPKREYSLDAHLRRLRLENYEPFPLEPLILDRHPTPLPQRSVFERRTEEVRPITLRRKSVVAFTYPGPKYKYCPPISEDMPRLIPRPRTRRLATWDSPSRESMVHGPTKLFERLSAPSITPAIIWSQKGSRKGAQVSFDLTNNLCYEYECSDTPIAQGKRIVGYVSSTGDAPGEGVNENAMKRRSLRRLRRAKETVWHREKATREQRNGISIPSRRQRYSDQFSDQTRNNVLTGFSSNLYPSQFASRTATKNGGFERITLYGSKSSLAGQDNSDMMFSLDKLGKRKHYILHKSLPNLPTADPQTKGLYALGPELQFYKVAALDRTPTRKR